MNSYDVIIVGGGAVGSSVAYHLATEPTFNGNVLVVERDPTYETCSTALSWGGIRQQFSTRESIAMSAYGMAFYEQAASLLRVEDNVPNLGFVEGGYLLLASEAARETVKHSFELQRSCGVAVQWLEPAQIAEHFPEVNIEGLGSATFGYQKEGWIDPMSLLNAFKIKARSLGVQYVKDEVVDLLRGKTALQGVRLKERGAVSACVVVNAAGTTAAQVSAMAGIELPIGPQRLVTFVFDCERPVNHPALTEDVSGVILRPEGSRYLTGLAPGPDENPFNHDFDIDYSVFEERIWPLLAHRFPVFEAIKLSSAWAGHLDYNHFDQNAFIGEHPHIKGLLLANGFSGHGLQHSPATGRALMELIVFGGYRSLDLGRLGVQRLLDNRPIQEAYIMGVS